MTGALPHRLRGVQASGPTRKTAMASVAAPAHRGAGKDVEADALAPPGVGGEDAERITSGPQPCPRTGCGRYGASSARTSSCVNFTSVAAMASSRW